MGGQAPVAEGGKAWAGRGVRSNQQLLGWGWVGAEERESPFQPHVHIFENVSYSIQWQQE